MIDTTTENFWKAWVLPIDPPASIFYRLYYNDQGRPVCYTMEDLPGNYIEVDRETYLAGSFDVQVVNQKLIHLSRFSQVAKLKPSDSTGTACDPRDICVVVGPDQTHVKWNYQ